MNEINNIQYQVICGDCENIENVVPKKEYSLVIAGIPHGYNITHINYDCEPYSYHSFNKVVTIFLDVTMSPNWIFFVFHSDAQGGAVLSSFKSKANARKQLYW